MSKRFVRFIGVIGSLALSVPVFADQADTSQAGGMQGTPSELYSPSDVANPPTEYQDASDIDPTGAVDARAKVAWLTECRRRANLYNPSQGALALSGSAADQAKELLTGQGQRGYDYCEAYLDDYYRNYSQAGTAYSYGNQGNATLPQPMQVARTAATPGIEEPYEEIITEEYVPVRSRSIPRRTETRVVRDKRVRIR
jgi:hypothetical protein